DHTLDCFSTCPVTLTPVISTLSLHDALPIFHGGELPGFVDRAAQGDSVVMVERQMIKALREDKHFRNAVAACADNGSVVGAGGRSEEHTSELQSPYDLVCRLLLEKKNTPRYI